MSRFANFVTRQARLQHGRVGNSGSPYDEAATAWNGFLSGRLSVFVRAKLRFRVPVSRERRRLGRYVAAGVLEEKRGASSPPSCHSRLLIAAAFCLSVLSAPTPVPMFREGRRCHEEGRVRALLVFVPCPPRGRAGGNR